MQKLKNPTFKIAASAAASWAWGTSLVVGRSTLQTKGMMAFLIWAICNSIALPLFSLVVHRVKPMKSIINSKPLTLFMTVIQVFSVWIQMNAIYEICMQTGFMSSTVAQIISYTTAAIFIMAMYKNGLFRSIMSDQVQWGGVIVFSALICLVGWLTHNTNTAAITMNATADNLHWGIKSGLILFCGPIMDIQHWQRIDYADQQDAPRAYVLAGLMFAGYLILVALTASLQFNAVMYAMEDDEKEVAKETGVDNIEAELLSTLAFLKARELRLMKRIAAIRDLNAKMKNMMISSISTKKSEKKTGTFTEDENGKMVKDKGTGFFDGEIATETTTNTSSTEDALNKLESELSKVQAQKVKVLAQLDLMHINRERLEIERLRAQGENEQSKLANEWVEALLATYSDESEDDDDSEDESGDGE